MYILYQLILATNKFGWYMLIMLYTNMYVALWMTVFMFLSIVK